MKFLLRFFGALLVLAVVLSPATFKNPAFALGCTFSVSPTTIAPHGDVTVTVQNATAGTEYAINFFDGKVVQIIFTAGSSGTFTATRNVDDLFGPSSPEATSGSFKISARTTVPAGFPNAEDCTGPDGSTIITIVVNPDLSPPPPLAENTAALCSDGIDNDLDGLIDLADPDCAAFVPSPPSCTLNANPTAITQGQSSTLSWGTLNSNRATLLSSPGGVISLNPALPSGFQVVTPTSTSTYTLIVFNSVNQQATCATSVTLNIPPPPPPPAENTAALCSDGIDNDLDGLIDLADPDCAGFIPFIGGVPPVSNVPPEGWLDPIDCNVGTIRGWSVDLDDVSYQVSIHIYIDRFAGQGGNNTPDAILTANTFRPDVNQFFQATRGINVGDFHGFEMAIPDSLKDGNAHPVHAYPIDNLSAFIPVDLQGSPKTFTCASGQPPVGGGGAGGGGALFDCPSAGKSFNIKDCFHPAARIAAYSGVTGFGNLAGDILLILTSIAAALTVIFVVISGIKFVTSGGDPKKLASASSTLTYAIVGIAVTILAFIILRIVQFFLQSRVPIS